MEFKKRVEESQCKTEVSAKVYLENETKRKADEKAKEPLAKRSQNKAIFSSQEDESVFSEKLISKLQQAISELDVRESEKENLSLKGLNFFISELQTKREEKYERLNLELQQQLNSEKLESGRLKKQIQKMKYENKKIIAENEKLLEKVENLEMICKKNNEVSIEAMTIIERALASQGLP